MLAWLQSGPIIHTKTTPSLSPMWPSSGARRAHGCGWVPGQAAFSAWLPLHHRVRVARSSLFPQPVPAEEAQAQGRIRRRVVHRARGRDRPFRPFTRRFWLKRNARRWRPRDRIGPLHHQIGALGGRISAPGGSPPVVPRCRGGLRVYTTRSHRLPSRAGTCTSSELTTS